MRYGFFLSLFMLLASCNDREVQIANLRVDHFKQSAIGIFPAASLVLLIQRDDEIGSNDWQNHYSGITDFDYEWGHVYDLRVKIRTIDNPPQDASSIEYVLEEIISKQKVASDRTFIVQLKSSFPNTPDFVEIGSDAQYWLLKEHVIDCANHCDQLDEFLVHEDEFYGVFVHQSAQSIELQELILR